MLELLKIYNKTALIYHFITKKQSFSGVVLSTPENDKNLFASLALLVLLVLLEPAGAAAGASAGFGASAFLQPTTVRAKATISNNERIKAITFFTWVTSSLI